MAKALKMGEWPVRIFVYPQTDGSVKVWHPMAQFGDIRHPVRAIVRLGDVYEGLPFSEIKRAADSHLALLFHEDGTASIEEESALAWLQLKTAQNGV